MAQSFSDYFGIDSVAFDATGALDPILDVDTRLFIDPALVRVTTVPELLKSHDKVVQHFEDLLKVVQCIEKPDDRMWREALKMLNFPEVSGLSIGYATKGTSGSGMGPRLRSHLLESVWRIVKAGVADPALFELVGIFEDGVGPDRISDMVARIIAADLILFTQRVCSDCGIPMKSHRLVQMNLEEDLPTHPVSGSPLILVPREVLRNLPVAMDYADVRWIAEHNETLRSELNSLIGSSWKQVTLSEQKEKLRRDFVRFPEVLSEIIRAYREEQPTQYDFANDPAGEVVWYRASKRLPVAAPLALQLPASPTLDDVEVVVVKICDHFKRLIEDNQLGQLLYDGQGKSKHESAAQLLFFGVASAYCEANGLDLSPESDAGRGPVDFKVSSGFAGKVLVEVKLTSNKQLQHGFTAQLPIYQRAEGAQRGIYLVIDNGGATEGRLNSFRDLVQNASANAPRVVWVDSTRLASASKANS